MTKKQFRQLYYEVFNDTFLRAGFWTKYRESLITLDHTEPFSKDFISIAGQIYMKEHSEKKLAYGITMEDFARAKEALTVANVPQPHYVSFGNCTEAATPPPHICTDADCMGCDFPKQEKGNNPMGYNQATATNITSSLSDEAIQRGYLLEHLKEDNQYTWKEDTKYGELRELFFINVSQVPKSGKELLDAIQHGKFTVDQKRLDAAAKHRQTGEIDDEFYDDDYYSLYYGITFTDYPKPDRKGYDAAVKAYELAVKQTERKIIVGTPAEGLAALEALEAWLPTGKAN